MKTFSNNDYFLPKVLAGLLCSVMLGAAPGAQAANIPAGYVGLTYNAILADGVYGVNQIHFINQQANGNLGWGYPYFLNSEASSVTQIWPTFAPYESVAASFGVGLVYNIPGDPPDTVTTHLAVLGDFSADQIGLDFSALFPDVVESALIDALANNTVAGGVIYQLSQAATEQGLYISPGGDFDIVAFSQGQVVGAGTFTIETPAVPEAETYALMLAGLGLIGWRTWRRG